ncbi:MAG: hypothetical protein WD749_06415 [Phycisphaerales bacterium]
MPRLSTNLIPRRAAAAIALISLGILVASVWAMAQRVDEYHRTSDKKQYSFIPVEARRFTYAGREVELADMPTAGRGAGDVSVTVRYGDETLTIPATVEPGPDQLPDLIRHKDWLQILRFAERGRTSYDEFKHAIDSGQVRDRLALVVRTPPPGRERLAPGEVFRKEWLFDLYEFNPEGGFAHERLTFPRGKKPREGELIEGTWQFYAALIVMPKLGRPSPRFLGDALPAMGWTLPAAGFSGLALTFATAMALAPRRR